MKGNCLGNLEKIDANQCQMYGRIQNLKFPVVEKYLLHQETQFWNDYLPKLGRLNFTGKSPSALVPFQEPIRVNVGNFNFRGISTPNGVRFHKVPFAKKPVRFEHSVYQPVTSTFISESTTSTPCLQLVDGDDKYRFSVKIKRLSVEFLIKKTCTFYLALERC